MHTWFIKLAVLYFLLGNLVGMSMSMTHNFDLMPFHAHVNLLGWVSSALFGLIYHSYSATAASRLLQWHFWLYNIGFIVMMLALFCVLQGNMAFEPAIGVGATALVIGVLLFLINVFKNVRG